LSGQTEIFILPSPIPYLEMLELQYKKREAVQRGEAPNTLYLMEHPPTITLGRNTKPEHLLRTSAEYATLGIKVINVDRGGDVTYHGPGQLVAYPILNLNDFRPSINWYIRTLEQCLIDLLSVYNLNAERMPGHTGVWINGAKIAAIGVGIRNWITYHGIALNVSPNLSHFTHIIPCGIADKPVTSLDQLLDSPPNMEEMQASFILQFKKYFS